MPTETAPPRPDGHRLTVLGAGTMGAGITSLALMHGVPVTLVDVDQDVLDRARTRIDHQTRVAQLMGEAPDGVGPGTLTTATSPDAVADATVVIEAVTEDHDLKAALLADVGARTKPGTILVTNTSSIPVDDLAGFTARPGELVGTHFMNPPYLIRTVEVVRGPRTGQRTLDTLDGLLAVLRRESVVVADAPGFVTSRLLHPMINDAARIVQEGTASAEDVDALMVGCLGHATGPLRTADMIGLDNLVDSLRVLHERTGDDRCRPCDLLLEKVAAGDHGRKSGRGFFTYERTEQLS
ncbi:3-hydroxyacyl-CoA dehydrogenase family protein [Nocardiopsis aegyptia]|uniref:Methoxymalonate biosynthesis protein n=1 Tax=Nocardiopsis aegyptia TaxID=220378 RepID=A0A7Z0EKK4_9ACTN|nr:3-hydroxyacyl-CoA dehydrogenase family protein [Nocardiopsis aegyptia]NYJ33764.1 methoxymalonate biosynthesis protein [Nocardiopsis aegyptia]